MTCKNRAAATYERYQALREQAKMTDSDMARAAGVSRSTFTGWKAGKYTPKIDKTMAISEVLGVDVRVILEGGAR